MKTRVLLPLCAMFALLLVACAKPEEVTTNRSESPSTANSASTPATVTHERR